MISLFWYSVIVWYTNRFSWLWVTTHLPHCVQISVVYIFVDSVKCLSSLRSVAVHYIQAHSYTFIPPIPNIVERVRFQNRVQSPDTGVSVSPSFSYLASIHVLYKDGWYQSWIDQKYDFMLNYNFGNVSNLLHWH